jgi:GlpG protein
MPAIKALETDLGPEMAAFSRHLWARRIPHRVIDEGGGRQLVVVGSEQHALQVREDYRRWRAGALELQTRGGFARETLGRSLAALRSAPATACLLLLGVLGAAIVEYDHALGLLHWLTFTDLRLVNGKLVFADVRATYAAGQYWRLFTPVLLHFGALHLAFNALWIWELGRRLERARGTLTLLGVALITGAGGNIAQYMAAGGVLFGGLSGVIYGLLGYTWLWSRLTGDPRLALPRGLLGFMVGWLLVCMSGLVEALGFGAIANAAHAAGLALGALLGLGAALLYSRPAPPPD